MQYDEKHSNIGLTGLVGRVHGTPLYLGLVLTGGSALGPIAATDSNLKP
jgi:hypothetical protein